MTGDRCRARGLLLSLFVVLAVVAGATVPPTAGAQETAAGTGGPAATFNQSTVTEQRGDIAAIGLNLSGTATATVTVGSEAVNYRTNVTVNDTDDDGSVMLRMNTFVAGTGGNETGVYDATGNDTVTRTNRTTGRLDAPLDTSTYNLSVAVGGNRTDTAALELTRRTMGDLVTWTAPAASFDNVTNTTEVAAAVEDGRITTTDTVADGDVLVNQFKVSGIYGALAAANVTRLVERGALNVTMVQTNPGTNRPPKRLALNRSLENDSIRVVPDGRNDVLYVNVNTTAGVFTNGTPTAGDEFETTLTLNGESHLADGDRSTSANVTVVGAELGLGEVALAADGNQTVTGTTSVAPGSEVRVRLQNNGSGSFVRTNTTTVKSNGTFAAGFNLSTVAPRRSVSVLADGPLNTSDRTTATVRPGQPSAPANGTASLALADQRTTGETVTVENVTLPDGGFVVVHAPNVSSAPVGSVLGTSSYLENGSTQDVEITLDEPLSESTRLVVMAHRDTNENRVYDFGSSNGSEDGPYTTGTRQSRATVAAGGTSAPSANAGEPVTASARIRVTEVTQRTTTGATTGGAAATDDAMGATTGEDGPGFGPLLGVFALAALSVLALARRD